MPLLRRLEPDSFMAQSFLSSPSFSVSPVLTNPGRSQLFTFLLFFSLLVSRGMIFCGSCFLFGLLHFSFIVCTLHSCPSCNPRFSFSPFRAFRRINQPYPFSLSDLTTAMKEAPPPEDATGLLDICNRLLASLLDDHLLSTIHTFRGKWSILRTKLSLLHSHLRDLSDYSLSLSSNTLCLDLLSTVSATLSSAVSLAEKCQSLSPADGKLRTQSDLDSLSALLDRHVRDSDILLRSGVLQESASSSGDANSIPPALAAVSKKEAVRFEIRNLLTKLQIGAPESKASAMDSLLGLLHSDDKNVLIAVAQGIVPVLVRMLDDSCSPEMKEKTVSAIARVSTVESSKHVLLAEGLLLLNHLLRVLESGSGFAMERSCVALQALSFSKENSRAIGSRGGISSLLEICQAGTPSSQGVAAGVLRNLAQFEDTKENFMEENAIFVLVALVASGTAVARENAIGCLANLVADDEGLKLMVAREGVIDSLKSYCDSMTVGKGLEPAMELVRNLASYQPIGDVIVSEGFIPRIVPLLSCGVLTVRIAAAGAIYELGFSSKSRREIGECGCIPPLARMLEGKAVEEREVASKALSRLVLCALNKKAFKEEEKGIVNTVQLLDPLTQNLERKWPISILFSLSHSNKCRKQIVAAGACAYLQKLVELEVDGAKKLLEGLGRGKLWGVFSRP